MVHHSGKHIQHVHTLHKMGWTTLHLDDHVSFTLHDASVSQEKTGVVIPITISSQSDQMSCSALIDTGSPKIQHQLNLPAAPLESHYYLTGATGDALTTLGTV